MFFKTFSPKDLMAALLMLAGVVALGYGPSQSDGWAIAGLYGFLFAVYGFIVKWGSEKAYPFFFWLAILLRLSLLAATPNLSDDCYRFIWDGRLILQGMNPFDQTPRALMPGQDEALFAQLNSPDYHTVYPPVAQLVFALSVWLFPKSLMGAMVMLKVIHAAIDIVALWLLARLVKKWELPRRQVLIYALNPLIIIELTGNLHFEGAMVCLLALALIWMEGGKWYRSAWAFAGAIGAKLLPLMFLPFLIRRMKWPKVFYWSSLLGAGLLILFLPMLNSVFFSNMGSSLGLYFRSFEFNAGFYYLARWVGFQLKGYNLIHAIGPAFALLTFLLIIGLAWREKRTDVRNLPLVWLGAITIYLLFSTTVHPWYLALPVFFSALTSFRFPLLWSALAPLSYLAYLSPEVKELPWVGWVEYSLVLGMLAWEYRRFLLIPSRLKME